MTRLLDLIDWKNHSWTRFLDFFLIGKMLPENILAFSIIGQNKIKRIIILPTYKIFDFLEQINRPFHPTNQKNSKIVS